LLKAFVVKRGRPNAELLALDAKKVSLTAALAEPPLPALHPKMAEVFRKKATTLAAGLEHDEHRDAARQALRGFIDKIVIPPGDGLLQVLGNLAAMLAAAQGRQQPSTRAMLVAGARNRQYRRHSTSWPHDVQRPSAAPGTGKNYDGSSRPQRLHDVPGF
jgi:hypothetical protein